MSESYKARSNETLPNSDTPVWGVAENGELLLFGKSQAGSNKGQWHTHSDIWLLLEGIVKHPKFTLLSTQQFTFDIAINPRTAMYLWREKHLILGELEGARIETEKIFILRFWSLGKGRWASLSIQQAVEPSLCITVSVGGSQYSFNRLGDLKNT